MFVVCFVFEMLSSLACCLFVYAQNAIGREAAGFLGLELLFQAKYQYSL